MTAPARVKRLAPDLLEITIREGRKRQVRRMCEAVGHPVASLERVAFGPLGLKGLEPGEHRRLTASEIERLRGSRQAPPQQALIECRAPMRLIALRGATTVELNESAPILEATGELMRELLERNALEAERPRELHLHAHARTSTPSSRPSRRATWA